MPVRNSQPCGSAGVVSPAPASQSSIAGPVAAGSSETGVMLRSVTPASRKASMRSRTYDSGPTRLAAADTRKIPDTPPVWGKMVPMTLRVVAISDTHNFHDRVSVPEGESRLEEDPERQYKDKDFGGKTVGADYF